MQEAEGSFVDLGRGLKEIAGFVLIIFVLMVKPYGLFGQREIERV